MPNTTLEAKHEVHNRVALEVAARILDEFPDNVEKLVLLETLVSGVIKLMTKSLPLHRQPEVRQQLLDVLHGGISDRLKED